MRLREVPWAPQDPLRRRAFGTEHARQERNGARVPFQLALHYLRFIIAGGVADAWAKFGGLGVTLSNLAHIAELSVARDLETASR